MKNSLLFVMLLFSITIMAGCSGNVPLSGKITFADNGEPLSEGTIVFSNGSQQARSSIGKDGKYTLSFEREGDGLPRGEYRIVIQAVHSESKIGKDPLSGDDMLLEYKETPLIADKYKIPETSGLTFTADGKMNVFDIKVERAAAKK